MFLALAHEARRQVLLLLGQRGDELPSGYLAAHFQHSWPTTSRHLKVLEQAGLLSRTIEGRSHHCQLSAGPLAAADRWLAYYERFWSMRLDDLERALTRDSNKRSRK